jgi:preprotein translocase subunit SecF
MIELFKDIKVDWLGKRKLFLAISGAVMLVGLVSLVVKGSFNYGVDFKGGTIVKVRFKQKPDIEKIRQLLSRCYRSSCSCCFITSSPESMRPWQ